MNYIKEAEEILSRYRDLDWVINNLKKEYDRLCFKGAPRDISAVDFQAVHGGSSGEDAFQTFCKMQDIDERIKELLAQKERVENALKKLSEHEKLSYDYLNCRYVEGLTLEEVSDFIGYSINSKTSLCNIKDKAIKQFIFYYYGKI